jgi:hypothetical protein
MKSPAEKVRATYRGSWQIRQDEGYGDGIASVKILKKLHRHEIVVLNTVFPTLHQLPVLGVG